MKNKIFRYIISIILSILCVWFVVSFLYFFATGNVTQFLISGSIILFITLVWLFNDILKS